MSKLNNIWQNRKLILEGIGNTLVKRKIIEEIAKERKEICLSCPNLNQGCNKISGDCCGVCGCMIDFKTRSMKSSCPQSKWAAVKVNK